MHSTTALTSETHRDVPKPPRRVEGARRMLNLLFSLHVSPWPLTTSEIVDDPEIGYLGKKSAAYDSRCRAFRRDRETLAEHGVHIREVLPQSAGGVAVNEESAWAIDRERTHAAQGVLSPYDAEEVVCAIDQIFELHADDPTLWPLQTARTKLCELAGRDPSKPERTGEGREDLKSIWNAFKRLKPVEFVYRDARSIEKRRMMDTYGMFTRGTHSYLVGFDHDARGLRTFRTDRILSAKHAPDTRPSYAIPAEFDVAGHQFLPFDFSRADATPCTFTFPAGIAGEELALITQGRGRLTSDNNVWIWNIAVRDLDAAAAFTLERANLGMRALGPRKLVEHVRNRIERSVNAHE